MFTRIALRIARQPVHCTPYRVSLGTLGGLVPDVRIAFAHSRPHPPRITRRRRARRASSLVTSASSLARLASATARELARRRPSLEDSTVLLG